VLAPTLGLHAAALADPRVEVVDRTFDTGASMFAYTELELSGEPLAEALGLDLDALDPNQIDVPTPFDYATAIESYEYSEEAMYALDYQSRMGIHLANGPLHALRGGTRESHDRRLAELATAAGLPATELPANLHPISLPYTSGSPELAGAVDTRAGERGELVVQGVDGEERTLVVAQPAYLRDFSTLAWKGTAEPRLSPGALGGALLKEVLWAQDFLGGMHLVEDDAEVDATAADMDRDEAYALGVSSIDGANGLLLLELAWDKLLALQSLLAYDGARLGVGVPRGYAPGVRPLWFPHAIRVAQAERGSAHAIGALDVVERRATLRDTWLLLWAVSELYALCDGRDAHPAPNPAFRAVFDGAPFPAASAASRRADASRDDAGTPREDASLSDASEDDTARDPFSLASRIANLLFLNLAELHFDPKAGTLVDDWDGERGSEVTAFDAAYAIVALSVFQRARDALPVGYASGENGAVRLHTADGRRALDLIRAQARTIVSQLMDAEGHVADRYVIGVGRQGGRSLASQLAAIRGLGAAFVATGDVTFRDAARRIYLAMEREMYDPQVGTFADAPGKPTDHTPWTAGAIAGGLRAMMLHFRNDEGESEPSLSLAHLTGRYAAWLRIVINGAGSGSGMQLAEWLGETGEHVVISERPSGARATRDRDAGVDARESARLPKTPGDTDRDGVRQVTAAGGTHGTAAVLAGRVRVSPALEKPSSTAHVNGASSESHMRGAPSGPRIARAVDGSGAGDAASRIETASHAETPSQGLGE
jgi:hypothetical protein